MSDSSDRGRIVREPAPYRLQPARKVAHAALGVLVAATLALSGVSRTTALAVIAGMLALAMTIDAVRLTVPRANGLFYRLFGHFAMPSETNRILSSTWYTLGLLLTVTLFPRPAAVSAVLVLALADPAAAFVGTRWGSLPFLGGTVQGTLAFAVVAFAIMASRHDPVASAFAGVICALAERGPLEDNLAVPLAAGGTLMLLA